jgi:hypothetical protein
MVRMLAQQGSFQGMGRSRLADVELFEREVHLISGQQ